jgi:ribosome-associated protein
MNDEKSKSQSRREALALKAFGEKLLALSPRQLEQLPLPADLNEVVVNYRKIKSRLAQKRHVQHLANFQRHMAKEVIDRIVTAYDKMISSADLNSPRFRLIEQWRQRLIEEGRPALTKFLSEYPCEEVQQLRHLIRKATADMTKQQDNGASRLLFRFIREHIT